MPSAQEADERAPTGAWRARWIETSRFFPRCHASQGQRWPTFQNTGAKGSRPSRHDIEFRLADNLAFARLLPRAPSQKPLPTLACFSILCQRAAVSEELPFWKTLYNKSGSRLLTWVPSADAPRRLCHSGHTSEEREGANSILPARLEVGWRARSTSL